MVRRRGPSFVRRPSVVHNSQTSSSQKPLGRSKPNFMWSLLWYGGTKFCSRHVCHMAEMAATPIYGKTLQKSSPEPACRFSRNFVCSIRDMQKIKPDFLRNYSADLNQILYESFQVAAPVAEWVRSPHWPHVFLFLFLLWFNVPVNNFSVMLRRSHLFLGITSTFGE